MKKKFLTNKWLAVSDLCYFCAFPIICLIIYLLGDKDEPVLLYQLGIPIIAFNFYIVLIPLALIWSTETITFEEEYIIYKRNIFCKNKEYPYSRMTDIQIEYAHSIGLGYGAVDRKIFVFFNGRKKAAFLADINYQIIQYLLKNKPVNCKVRVNERIIKKFTEEQREPLMRYLTIKQKKELERLLEKKNRRKRKKTA